MIFVRSGLSGILICLTWAAMATPVSAQRDRVYDRNGKNYSGKITSITAQGVEVDQGGSRQKLTAGDILKIMFEGDPAELTRGRELAIDGQYEQAIEQLRKIDFGEIDRDLITADAVFYMTMSEAKLALAGKGAKDAAAKKLVAFARKYRTSWHFFDAAKLLGDLALGLKEYDQAEKYYGSLRSAADTDTKIESVYLTGWVKLKQGESAAAIADFDKLLGINPQTSRATRLQALAGAGKAAALAADGQGDQALELLSPLVADLTPTDLELAARIYNAQGAAYEAKEDAEGAVLAYLHTHLMFSSIPDAHAESLGRLVELWPKVGKPDEAAKARQELQQRYPGF